MLNMGLHRGEPILKSHQKGMERHTFTISSLTLKKIFNLYSPSSPFVRVALRSYNYAREYFLFIVPIASVPVRASCDGNFGLSGGCASVGSVQFDYSLDLESLLKPPVIPLGIHCSRKQLYNDLSIRCVTIFI